MDGIQTEKQVNVFNYSIGDTLDTKLIEEKIDSDKITETDRDREVALWIDRQARIVFPVSWIIFMFLYFFYLAEVHKETQPINIPLSN